jgi:hypothetical protein
MGSAKTLPTAEQFLSADGSVRRIGSDDDLEAPDMIPGFRIRVGELIEP